MLVSVLMAGTPLPLHFLSYCVHHSRPAHSPQLHSYPSAMALGSCSASLAPSNVKPLVQYIAVDRIGGIPVCSNAARGPLVFRDFVSALLHSPFSRLFSFHLVHSEGPVLRKSQSIQGCPSVERPVSPTSCDDTHSLVERWGRISLSP